MATFCSLSFFSIPVRVNWNIGDNGNLFLKLNSKLRLCQVVLTIPISSPENLTLTVVEVQLVPDNEKSDSGKKFVALIGQYILKGVNHV